MSSALLGALVGLAFAAAEYVWFGALIRRAERRGVAESGPKILDWVRKGQLIAYPLIGWFAGPLVIGQLGV